MKPKSNRHSKPEPLKLLERIDKWYVGGGNRLLWAPPFPQYPDSPGFWDGAQYYNYELKPVFTWTLLDEDGRELLLRCVGRKWDPAVTTVDYECSRDGVAFPLKVTEERCVLPNDVLTCAATVLNTSRKRRVVHLVAWTAQEHDPSKESTWLSDIVCEGGVVSFTKTVRPSVSPRFQFACAFGLNVAPSSFSIQLSERVTLRPFWETTPFAESFGPKGLPGTTELGGVSPDGLVFAALHIRIVLKPRGASRIVVAFGAAASPEESRERLRPVRRSNDPVEMSRMNWRDHFGSVPDFRSSDEFFTRYYWYRWYGLRLNTIYGNEGNYRRPFVCEGVESFRAPISYSAPCHMLENRWMHEPELAQGSLSVFLDNQREDGGFRGYIDVDHYRQEMFYHANWGNAIRQLQLVHPSMEFLESIYGGLKRYAAYFDRERDEEVSGLYDIENHYETGQEYMHRYIAVHPAADQKHWGEVFRLKGVDVTVYIYELKRALRSIAEKLGKQDDAELWGLEAERIRRAVRERMWDPLREMFFDVDPRTGQRTGVKSATCFYPYFTDIVDQNHLSGLKKHLLNPKEFWTPFPAPSSSRDDAYFSPTPHWKGKRMNCPWNGRVWPMTNSHLAEALAICAVRFGDKLLKKKAVEFIRRFVRMMFFDGDPARPNCFEHYNPLTGHPSIYRGIDDYQHSWVNDLIIKYVCGIRPDEFSLVVDPFPFDLSRVVIDRVLVRGRLVGVSIHGNRFEVRIDGRQRAESTIGVPIEIQV